LFCHRQDAEGQARAGFGVPFEWDVPLLDGYRHEWLDNVSALPGVEGFAGCDTPGIEDRLARGRFDACIVNGWYLKSYLQAIRACGRLGVPAIVRGDSQLKGPRSRMATVAKYLPYRWLLRRVDAHLFVGKANRAYLRHYGVRPERLFFAPHFVDNARFAADAARAKETGDATRLRIGSGATDASTVFLFAGKLIEKKRPADFVDALASLARDGYDVRGMVVGSGPDEAGLRVRAASVQAPVTFAGFQNQTQIAPFYAAADCLVLPSDGRETWGLVVNEGMATGLPAIVSDAVGCGPDLIEEGRTGFTYPVGDVAQLAGRMGDMVGRRPDQRSLMRAAVLSRIENYSCAAAVEGTLRALEQVGPREANRVREPQHA
jgi:glycosyltransferase involved in cell wall biosynthesis